ncbi:MAG: OmpH family outer membrane protein [Saprospiraceae bacterium]|nr:OmpH family outer membrane protein [Saprospiraceae bacterium]
MTKEQDTLKALENDVKLKLIQRRETLYNPIIDKIDSLVKKIGKDNNYTMIFDSSQPGYLYLPEGDNLGALVLKELGLQ